MPDKMRWPDYLKMVREEAIDAVKDNPDADLYDVAHWVAESYTPAYNSDILQLAADNVAALAVTRPDSVSDGSPVGAIAANIYEALYLEAHKAIDKS